MKIRKKMVAPWRNILVKSKQKHNAPSHNNDNSDNYGVGVAWWQPEERHWLSRRRSIMPLPTIMTIMKNLGVYGVAWRHPKEIPRLSRSRTIMPPSHNDDNSKKFGFRGGMVAPWRNTSGKSKQKHNCPIPQWQFQKIFCPRGGMVAPWRNTLSKSKQKNNTPFPQ